MKNQWPWKVIISALLINVLIGVAYAWSIVSKTLTMEMGWTNMQASIPYSVNQVFYAVGMIAGGVLINRIGCSKTVVVSGILFAVGMVGSGFAHNSVLMSLFYGVLIGPAISLAYLSVLTAGIRWIPAHKRGLISGLCTSAYAFTSIYLSPVLNWLINSYSLAVSFFVQAAVIAPVLFICSHFMKDPPKGYNALDHFEPPTVDPNAKVRGREYNWKQMIKTGAFYKLFLLMTLCTGVTLIMTSQLAQMISFELGITDTVLFVSLYSVGNCFIRPFSGRISDRFPRHKVVAVLLLIGVVNLALFSVYNTYWMFCFACLLMGAVYGGFLSTLPAFVSDFFGPKNFSVNYSVVGTSVMIAAFTPMIIGGLVDALGSYTVGYFVFAGTLLIAVCIAASLDRYAKKMAADGSAE